MAVIAARRMPGAVGLAILAGVFSVAVQAGVIGPDLAAELAQRSPQDGIAVIVTLADRVDHRLFRKPDRSRRDTALVRALKQKSASTQAPHRAYLLNNGGRRLRELWSINGMAVTLPAGMIPRLAARPGIRSIRLDATLQAPTPVSGNPAPAEWNLNVVNAPDLWSLGHTGAGVVVANMDTGVDAEHPDLVSRWRGGGNSWFDPHGEHATPYDSDGHGTQTMAIIVGGAAGGTAIGMAPDARWIAAKLYNDAGVARYSDIHLAFQWLLDPDGDVNTLDMPDVVNASWGLVGSAGQCIAEFSDDIDALRTAGIAVVFSAGNDGPAAQTSLSPANNPQAFSAGAVDAGLTVASFSSRGASACDGGIYPKLVAPGVGINTADLSFGGYPMYVEVSGTSFAAPHAAGAIALLAGAFPDASVSQIETALTQAARDLGMAGEDNSYGYGLVDVMAAYRFLLTGTGSPPTISSTPLTEATEGSLYSYAVVASDEDGDLLTYTLDAAPGGMTIGADSGVIAWTPDGTQLGTNAVTVRVTDARGLSATQSFGVVVTADINDAPVALNDIYRVTAGSTLDVSAAGILANDSDADGDVLSALLRRGPANGRLTLNSDGSFRYVPNDGFSGLDRFVYRAYDGALYSGHAVVRIRVMPNRAPVARRDSASAATWRSGSPTATLIDVLANDFDRDGQLDPTSVTITRPPNRGGTVQVHADGTLAYTPGRRFAGTEWFLYQVSDQGGAVSNVALVKVTVQ